MKRHLIKLLALCALLLVPVAARATSTTVSSSTLTGVQWGGTTATLKIYATQVCGRSGFTTSDSVFILAGAAGSTSVYKTVSLTLSGSTLTVPTFTIDTTTDSIDCPAAKYSGVFYDSKGGKREFFFQDWAVPASLGTPTTIAALRTYNLAATISNPPSTYLTSSQTTTLINQAVNVGNPAKAAASPTPLGRVAVSVTPADAALPVAVGDNDPRVPSQAENDALAGTSGSPSSTNKYVTDSDSRLAGGGTSVNPKNAPYNARGDGLVRTDCSMTNGSAVLTCTAGQFTTSDPTKVIAVYGAGALNAGYRQPLSTTIASRQSATQVTLAAPAQATVTNSERVVYGTDDSAALQAAVDALAVSDGNGSNIGGTLDIPAGTYMTKGIEMPCSVPNITYRIDCPGGKTYNNITIRGAGPEVTALENWDVNANVGLQYMGLINIGQNAEAGTLAPIYTPGNTWVKNIDIHGLSLRQVKYPTSANVKILFGYAVKELRLHNCFLTGYSYEGVYMGGGDKGTYWYVYDNRLDDIGHGGPGYSGTISAVNMNGDHSYSHNNTITNSGQCFESGGRNILHEGNRCLGPATGGNNCFNLGSTGLGVFNVTIKDNYCENYPVAINAGNGNGALDRLVVEGNVFKNGYITITGGADVNPVADGEVDTVIFGRSIFRGNTIIYSADYAGTRGILFGSARPGTSFNRESFVIDDNTVAFDGANPILRLTPPGGRKWQPSTAYGTGSATTLDYLLQDYVVPTVNNSYLYKTTTAGTSGTSEPTWCLTLSCTVSDGTAVWTNVGAVPTMSVSNFRFTGPLGFVETNPSVSVDSTSRNYLSLSGISANYNWQIDTISAADMERVPQNSSSANDTYRIPANAKWTDMDRWFDTMTNGSGVSQALPWAGYFRGGTVLRRTHPVPGAGGMGLVVTTEGYAARPFQATTAYSTYGTFTQPTTPNGHFYFVTVTGTTGAEPAWCTTSGCTVTSGSVTLKEGGAAAVFSAFP